MDKSTEWKFSNKTYIAAVKLLNIKKRLLHPPDILIAMNVDLMKLVL